MFPSEATGIGSVVTTHTWQAGIMHRTVHYVLHHDDHYSCRGQRMQHNTKIATEHQTEQLVPFPLLLTTSKSRLQCPDRVLVRCAVLSASVQLLSTLHLSLSLPYSVCEKKFRTSVNTSTHKQFHEPTENVSSFMRPRLHIPRTLCC